MKEKVITIKPKGISQKQYSSFLLELNLMKKACKPYGVNVEISAPGLRKIILFGTRAGVAGKDLRGSYNIQRRTLQSRASDKTNVSGHDVIQPAKLFRSV